MIPCGKNGILIYPGHREEAPVSSVQLDVVNGALAHFHGNGRLRGTLLVAGRTDGRRYDHQELRLLETLAGNVGTAMASSQVIDGLAASLADATRLAELVDSSNDAIIAFTPRRVVTSWNAAAEALFGYPASEVVGGVATFLVPPERVQDLRLSFARACRGGQVRNLEFDARRRDGTAVPISAALSPIRNAAGEITGVSVIARDETERTLQESALRRSRDRFRNVFEGSSVGIGVIGSDFRWLRVNETLRRTVTTTEGSLVGQRFEQLVDRDDVGSAHEVVARLLRGEGAGSTIEIRFRAPAGGRAVLARFTVRPLLDGDGTMQVLCLVEDVTDRLLAEQQARETEARLHQAVLDLTSVREPAEVVKATLRAVRDVIDAESAAVIVLDGEADGPADLVLGDDADAGELGALLRDDLPAAITEAARGPVRLPQDEDREGGGTTALPWPAGLRSYLAVPVRFEGRLLATIHVGNRRHAGTFTDADVEVATVLAAQAGISLENACIHQRALALVRELDEANASLHQASVIRSRILASVSHELRTPLHSILVAAQLVQDSGVGQAGSRRVRGLGATIEGSGRHLLGLVDDFLDLSTIEAGAFELRPTAVFLAPLLREVRRDIAPLASEKGILLAFARVPGVVIVADPLRLRQVLLNLLSNAVKFTGRGGRVRVSVRSEAGSMLISVQDTGIGIAPENLERAFLPFEQVSPTDAQGAGLGLAISRRITELHGGTLTAESAVGRGSTFTIALPLAVPDVASEAASG
jgi:PAS domain S-box-containing protein